MYNTNTSNQLLGYLLHVHVEGTYDTVSRMPQVAIALIFKVNGINNICSGSCYYIEDVTSKLQITSNASLYEMVNILFY